MMIESYIVKLDIIVEDDDMNSIPVSDVKSEKVKELIHSIFDYHGNVNKICIDNGVNVIYTEY